MALKYESNVNSTYLNSLGQQYGLTPDQLKGVQGPGGSPLAVGNTGYSLSYNPTSQTTQLQSTAQAPAGAGVTPASTAPAPIPQAGGGSGVNTSISSYNVGSPLASQTVTQPGTGGGTIQNTFRDALLGVLNTNPNDVKLSDPDLAPQARASQDAQTRSLGEQQRTAAEQGFASGALHTGAYGTTLGALQQQQGEAIGQFNANLLSQARQQRLSTLLSSLGLGGDLINSASAQGVQSSLGQGDLNLRAMLGSGQLSLGLLQALLGDRQANNQLGYNIGTFQANQNNKAAGG